MLFEQVLRETLVADMIFAVRAYEEGATSTDPFARSEALRNNVDQILYDLVNGR